MRLSLALLAVGVALLPGCATKEAGDAAPRPGAGLAEYQQLVRESRDGIARAVELLDRVSAQTNHCPAKMVRAFAREVETLQVESVRVRSRSQAIQARGDAYFNHWEENLVQVKDAQVRALAEQHRPQLHDGFARIKLASQRAGEGFKPFLSGLRKLENALENDAGSVGTTPTRELIRATREKGGQVSEALAAIGQELGAMSALLTPAKLSTKK
jgi:hypothetical protein